MRASPSLCPCLSSQISSVFQGLSRSKLRRGSYSLCSSTSPFPYCVTIRPEGDGGFLLEYWDASEDDGREIKTAAARKIGYVTSAYFCDNYEKRRADKGEGDKDDDNEKDSNDEDAGSVIACSPCNSRPCFPRLRGMIISDGHRGVGKTTLMLSIYYKFISLQRQELTALLSQTGAEPAAPMPMTSKITTVRMRKPILMHVLHTRWSFLPESTHFPLYVLPPEVKGSKYCRVTSPDIAKLNSCLSRNYRKSQGIQIVEGVDIEGRDDLKKVWTMTEYHATFENVEAKIDKELVDEVTWLRRDIPPLNELRDNLDSMLAGTAAKMYINA